MCIRDRTDTMQGFVLNRPHGYPGDFEIIDRIYTEWISPINHLRSWDLFFHWQEATIAVRNRKSYFKTLLTSIEQTQRKPPAVLNVGCGPSRDIYEFLKENPATQACFECLDMDANAIAYSKNLLAGVPVTYHCRNAFRFTSKLKYDLVWSAGLFDYLDDKLFVFLCHKLYALVAPGGKLVIGNFSTNNPSRDYMEFGEWHLNHRSEDDLLWLARKIGLNSESVTIQQEPMGVNLFKHIYRQNA